jgi:hypothetical protein
MRRLAAGLLLVVALGGCGGSKHASSPPQNAYLTRVHVSGSSVSFAFKSAPDRVRARYEPRSQLSECGSGRRVPLRGGAFAVVHFEPAASAEIHGEQVVPTYTGPRRLPGPGPVLEAVKTCDFEADLGWAIGIERRLPLAVTQDGTTVTITFG